MRERLILRMTILCAVAALAVAAFAVQGARAADEKPDEKGVQFFLDSVEPIFQAHCYKCHGEGKSRGGFSLYTRELLMKGGDSGAVIDAEDVDSSIILDAINYRFYEMPPTGKLPAAQIEAITRWVKMGAPMPERKVSAPAEHDGPPKVDETTKSHWAFQPVSRPAIPLVKNSGWVRNEIDAFVLAKLEAAELTPNPPADRRTLCRRVYYDLLGLPPTPQQVEEFATDESPDAYERLVDELLDSPHYGEHWARYWLDLVRYAETNSFERDNPKPFVWKYRDYVIRSLNEDRPYDQFIVQQLAGDELPHPGKDAIIATGYYRLGPWDDEPADPELARYDELDDIITTTAQGFLGLTMNCARCHDHKLDPIPQADYYSFLAFFRNVRRYGIRAEETIYERSVRSIATPEEETVFEAQKLAYEKRLRELRDQLDEVDARIIKQLEGGERDDFQDDSVRLRIVRKHVGDLISQEEFDQYVERRKEWTQLRNNPPRSSNLALCVKEEGKECPVTNVLIRGNPHVPGDEVHPAFPEVLSPPEPQIVPPEDGESCGRRLALARWIASEKNPLTARVMVNRIWQGHFGRGIVRSSNNFGLKGEAPTHPRLLDWLAAEFVARGWSIKQVHRLILLSSTYRMSSAGRPEALEKDPQNDLFWRFDMRRLRAEEIRDSILAVNGTLNIGEMYGPSMYPTIPEEVLAGQSRPGYGWNTSPLEEQRRRSIYIHIKRSLTVPLLASFDVPETDFTCPVRFVTTQPTQALGMLNSAFLNEQARLFADDLARVANGDRRNQVELALARVFQRPPTPREIERGIELIRSLQADFNQSADDALKNFCLVALNLNEFIYLD